MLAVVVVVVAVVAVMSEGVFALLLLFLFRFVTLSRTFCSTAPMIRAGEDGWSVMVTVRAPLRAETRDGSAVAVVKKKASAREIRPWVVFFHPYLPFPLWQAFPDVESCGASFMGLPACQRRRHCRE